MPEIEIRRGESIEKALRRLKRKIDKEGILKQLKKHRHYEKPSEKRKQKIIEARKKIKGFTNPGYGRPKKFGPKTRTAISAALT